MNYRPDIEGLRALAILPVVIFHAWPPVLPGGSVGVDVFFVISGYLITTLLLQHLAMGNYSIAAFYAARIRRIFPGLFVMLALVAPVCVLLLEPAALHAFARQLGSTGLFLSNVELYRTTGYFDGRAELEPLLHTWSLAVEEQYYIVFPLLLAALWRFARAWVGAALLAVGLLSLSYCLWLMRRDAALAFYAAPSRTFELMVGSGLAWWMNRTALPPVCPAWMPWVGWMALASLLASLVFMHAELAFPGPMALWPCLSTAVLIWVGGAGRGGVARLLSAAPLRWIGAHSFSLYLWHWPVLVLARHLLLDEPSAWQALLCVAVSMLLACLSLRWVETPVRQAPVGRPALLVSGVLAMGVSLGLAGLLLHLADQRATRPGMEAELRAGALDISPDRQRCHGSGDRWIHYDARCLFGPADAPASLAVWGDSHGVELARALGDRAVGQRIAQLTSSSCPPALGYTPPGRAGCAQANEATLDSLISDERAVTVLLVARYEYYLSSPGADAFRQGLSASVRRLHDAGKRVLLLDPVPTYQYPVPAALAQRWLRGSDLSAHGQTVEQYRHRQSEALALVGQLTAHGAAQRVPLRPILCAQARCSVLDGTRSLYFDDNHLSMQGAGKVAAAVLSGLG